MPEIAFFATGLIAAPFIQHLYSILDTKIRNSVGNEKKAMEELQISLTHIKSLLNLAEEHGSNPAIREGIRDLLLSLYDAEDILDRHDYGVQQIKVHSVLDRFKRSFVSQVKKVTGKLDTKWEKFLKKVESINQMSQSCNQKQKSTPDVELPVAARKAIFEISSLADLTSRNINIFTSSLADLRSKHRLSGICIVGMPGIGKTAVAGSIYHNATKAKGSYNVVFWVSVPDNFSRRFILREMLVFLIPSASNMSNEVAITEALIRELKNKTFLLILDDVRAEHADVCREFITYLEEIMGKTWNSSIVLTTNDKQAGSRMETITMHKHELRKLSEEECWLVMEKAVNSIPSGLSSMGLEIAKLCGGLPLVASYIGEELRKNIAEDGYWEAVKNEGKLNSPHERKSILSELKRSSYDRLDLPLQKCFTYCSIFPKGYIYRRDELIQHWLAAGFLEQQEDVGNKYLKDLVSRYLLEVVEMDEFENIKSCKMHDEMHNLASLLSEHETCIWPDSHPIERNLVRWMRVTSQQNFGEISGDPFKRVRSLILERDVSLARLKKFSQRLRSLNVVARSKQDLQASIRKSRYVKHLDISGSEIKEIPRSLTKSVLNLQSLRFEGCNSDNLLSGVIEGLDSLRHIYYDENKMPRSIGKLTSLCTLLFVVGTEEGRKIAELNCLNKLRHLKISNLDQVPESEATEAKLDEKEDLLNLHFVWGAGASGNTDHESVLKGLRPNSKLKTLTIENYNGKNFPSWMVKSTLRNDASFCLNYLVHLELINCDDCDDYSSLGLLPKLEVLIVKEMPGAMTTMGTRSYYNRSSTPVTLFRALRKLVFSDMRGLKEWTVEEGAIVFPRLKRLRIWKCPELQTWRIDGASRELFKVSIQSCQNLQAISNSRRINILDIKDCPNLSRYDQTKMERITIDDLMVKPKL